MKTEIECRLLDIEAKDFIKKLKDNNASFIGDWIQRRNVYDFNPVKENSWIRLRTNGIETTLTIKEIKSSKIDGTQECEISVSDFETTDELLNKLGYHARSKQENRRIRFMLDNVEIDIDFWPNIPVYAEFEGETEDDIKQVAKKLDININNLISIDVEKVYNHYGYNIKNIPELKLEDEIRNIKFDI